MNTLVTMIYDLGALEHNTYRKSLDEYYKRAELLFKINCNVVFFVGSDEIYKRVYDERRKYGNENKTYIMVQKFEDTPYYSLLNKVNECDLINPIKGFDIRKDTNNYRILTWNKIAFLRKVIDLNINTDYYAWIDFGIYGSSCIPPDFKQIVETPSEKMKFAVFLPINYYGSQNIDFYKKRFSMLSGGFFCGNKISILKFSGIFHKELLHSLQHEKIAPLEEQIIVRLIASNKFLFDYVVIPSYGHLFTYWLK